MRAAQAKIDKDESAFILASLLISLLMITLIGITIMQLVVANFRVAARDVQRLHAQLAADAGLDASIVNLNTDNLWGGTAGEVVLYTSPDSAYEARYETSVAPGNELGERIITSTGRTYVPASATSPAVERTYEAVVEGLTPAVGSFSLVTGVGGLRMENHSKIVAGDVFVNGSIDMSNFAQIGLSTSPVLVRSAHQSCPVGGGAGYPTICAAGEPISISNPAWIYGDVCANNQITSSRMSNSGLVSPITTGSCGEDGAITPVPLPDHDRDAQKTNAGSTDLFGYSCDSNSAPPVTWPANYRITGDVFLGKKCEVIIEGDVWIEGDLTLNNAAKITISDTADYGVDGDRPSIMVDGSSGAHLYNSSQIVANADDVGGQIVTYWSDSGCSPDCATVTGTDLYNSRDTSTISFQQFAKAPQTLIYARWSQAEMNNGGDIGAIVAQTVYLRNSALITFGAGSGGGFGGSDPGSTFVVRSYKRVF